MDIMLPDTCVVPAVDKVHKQQEALKGDTSAAAGPPLSASISSVELRAAHSQAG